MFRASQSFFMVAAAAVALGGTAQAAPYISGSLYVTSQNVANDATIANRPKRRADVTFRVSGQPFNFASDSSYTVGQFLDSGSAYNVKENTPGTLASQFTNEYIYFTGRVSVFTGEVITSTHDDGIQLLIGNQLVIDSPLQTPPTTTQSTYNGPAGTFSFVLSYGECCTAPADLSLIFPTGSIIGTPEPGAFALFGLGVLGVGLARRKR